MTETEERRLGSMRAMKKTAATRQQRLIFGRITQIITCL